MLTVKPVMPVVRAAPIPGRCVHRWARRVDDRGHIIYHCIKPGCAAQVDFTAARDEYDRLTTPTTSPRLVR